MLGWVRGQSFSFRARGYAHNWRAPVFHGRMYSQDGRTRIDGYFERPSWTGKEAELFIEIAAYAFVAALASFSSLSGAFQRTLSRGPWLALIVFVALTVYLFWYVRRGLRWARPEILEFLQNTLLAQIEPRP